MTPTLAAGIAASSCWGCCRIDLATGSGIFVVIIAVVRPNHAATPQGEEPLHSRCGLGCSCTSTVGEGGDSKGTGEGREGSLLGEWGWQGEGREHEYNGGKGMGRGCKGMR